MSQSKLSSFFESCLNVAVGWLVGLVANLVVLPWFGYFVTFGDAAGISVVYTIISLVRSYAIRRWFNWRLTRG
jgi:hypothetical protein